MTEFSNYLFLSELLFENSLLQINFNEELIIYFFSTQHHVHMLYLYQQ